MNPLLLFLILLIIWAEIFRTALKIPKLRTQTGIQTLKELININLLKRVK